MRDVSVVFYVRDSGVLSQDLGKSLGVTVSRPVVKRGVLTVVGEVHFLAMPLSSFPKLYRISRRFRDWPSANPRVSSHKPDLVHEWDDDLGDRRRTEIHQYLRHPLGFTFSKAVRIL